MSAEPRPTSTPDRDSIELSVPLRTEYAATVRTLAASLGADAGFSVDELDDLRLALSEVFSALAEADDIAVDARAEVSFRVGQRRARIEVRTDQAAVQLDDLALGILRSVTDEFTIEGNTFVLVKQATETAANALTP